MGRYKVLNLNTGELLKAVSSTEVFEYAQRHTKVMVQFSDNPKTFLLDRGQEQILYIGVWGENND